MSTISIRKAQFKDLDGLARLFDGYRQFYECEPDLAGAAAWITANFDEQRSTVFVAEDGNALAGFTQLYPALCSVDMQPFYVLYDLFVDPSSRRAGIGRALMNTAADWARTQGACRIDLETAHTNVVGQSLYESLGYEQDLVFRKYSLDLTEQ
ncbi:MAG: GNAT family N-acetyltransferase [Luminiphilus sp.]|nr:GNAT family N-acetyltransferase [Luminiphilus sp.]